MVFEHFKFIHFDYCRDSSFERAAVVADFIELIETEAIKSFQTYDAEIDWMTFGNLSTIFFGQTNGKNIICWNVMTFLIGIRWCSLQKPTFVMVLKGRTRELTTKTQNFIASHVSSFDEEWKLIGHLCDFSR